MIIDTHHHFWHYDTTHFGWISDEMGVIRRDYLPADLAPVLQREGVDAVVTVQAKASLDETRWLLQLAREHAFVAGVVGWIDLTAADVAETLARFAADPKLVGVRHIVQAEADGFLARDDFNRGIAALRRHGLAYDIVVIERQLPQAIAFVDRHPSQRFILDHLAKPNNHRAEIEPWRSHMREFAKRPNVLCKISGGITEIDLNWTPAGLMPYFDAVLEAFGPQRLVFGSNWPVTESAGGYGKWIAAVRDWARKLSPAEQHQLMAANAQAFYRLDPAARTSPA
jgi:L-fuconolactonase